MSNISSIISSHNKILLRPKTTKNGFSCRTRKNCLLQHQCLTSNKIYQADVVKNANKGTKNYLGLAETSFKTRFLNHNKDLNHEQYKKAQNCQNIYGC